MKAIFYLPAHPSYFDDEYTQEEIDQAIAEYDKRCRGLISNGKQDLPVKIEFLLLREPGKSVTVKFDSSGFGDGQNAPEQAKARGIDQYRGTSEHELQIHVKNLNDLLETKRRGFW